MNKLFRKIVILLALITGIGVVTEIYSPTPVEAVKKTAAKKKTKKNVKKKKQKAKKVKKSEKKTNQKIKIDSAKTNKQAVAKLQHPTANVFINISRSDPNYYVVLAAMQAWNNTGTFTFKQMQNPAKANIRVTSNNYGATTWGGLTEMPNVPQGYRYGSSIYLNDYFMHNTSPQIGLAIAEHELGHAIGLMHDDSQPSDMNSAINVDQAYLIQPCDIAAVKAIYHEN